MGMGLGLNTGAMGSLTSNHVLKGRVLREGVRELCLRCKDLHLHYSNCFGLIGLFLLFFRGEVENKCW